MPPVGPELISPRSTRVLAARRLAKRNFRGKERLFLAEGPQAVREAAAHRADGTATLVELFTTAEAADRYADIVGAPRGGRAPRHHAPRALGAAKTPPPTPPRPGGGGRVRD
ncbi:TrmH family RNA methyltransferase, partial [Streptomyces sp. NPDC054826]